MIVKRIKNELSFHAEQLTIETLSWRYRGNEFDNRGGVETIILTERPDYKPCDIAKDMRVEFDVEINYKKAWRAKEHASLEINGRHKASYAYLPKYCEDLKAANPGSLVVLESTTENKFRRVFNCYGGSAEGFANCRPILGLDGTHLSSKYQGKRSCILANC